MRAFTYSLTISTISPELTSLVFWISCTLASETLMSGSRLPRHPTPNSVVSVLAATSVFRRRMTPMSTNLHVTLQDPRPGNSSSSLTCFSSTPAASSVRLNRLFSGSALDRLVLALGQRRETISSSCQQCGRAGSAAAERSPRRRSGCQSGGW